MQLDPALCIVGLGANGLMLELDNVQSGSTVASANAGGVLQSSGDIVTVGSLNGKQSCWPFESQTFWNVKTK
ncbi:hypothetical protein M3I54_33875 [Paraburkholderia sp. CNPSo 3274]|uniref:hypothetical protein n=1 Tax=Paraburkholderia sp. CNPSo 3274 TaxID=2940932 RepID=UPI0020B66E34|nr:hypothetical protein [Paraburkholderia sp. CNPSo 3274]MCP3711885.1 hypothetical protein [Paraburkholderia sp. CNPSo 3274]